jgi:phosphomannomutase
MAFVPTRIVFGTDGWRARIAEDFTFENVRRCATGSPPTWPTAGEQAKGVVVAYDRRFASRALRAGREPRSSSRATFPVAFSRPPSRPR